ncbi:MAG: hypothetical protein K6U04_00635 [Armatimonadetes bacterium]|nr:hypothetical protein [Armatimonadota bacterium]
MLTGSLVFGLIVLALAGLSIRERVKIHLLRTGSLDSFPETKASPLSRAVLNLVGLAGGIYLSLVMLLEFLKVDLPSRVPLGQVQVEPLAALSIGLAIVQPFVSRLFMLRRRW